MTERWPWVISLTFGLLHGFGFAGALSEVGLPQKDIPVALLFFNLGVEVGQLCFIVSMFGLAFLAKTGRASCDAPETGLGLARAVLRYRRRSHSFPS